MRKPKKASKKKAGRKKVAKKKTARKKRPWKPDERQRRFIEHFDACGVGSVAYIRAGYSEKGARTSASKLLANPNIRAAVDKLSAERTKRVSFDADNVLQELATLSTITIADFLDEDGDLQQDLSKIDKEALGAINSLEVTDGVDALGREVLTIKFKLHDRLKAIVAAGKHKDVQAFLEKVDVGGDFGDMLEAAAARMAKAKRGG